jgi:4-amino-4-deoxy-L-arabinose transferase-like glycosyltransferase
MSSAITTSGRIPRHALIYASSVYFFLHLLLFVHDLAQPDAFLTGDRGRNRMEKISIVLPALRQNPGDVGSAPWKGHIAEACLPKSIPADPFWGSLSAFGQPGDYIFQGLIWLLGGPYAVILVQVLLAYLATIYVYRISRYFLTEHYSVACACLYALLPASLMQPHQLVSEALFNPTLIFATYYFIRHVETGERRALLLACSFLAAGILIRFQLALIPLVFLFLILLFDRRDLPFRTCALLSVPYSLVGIWLVVNFMLTDEVGLGKADISLGLSLYIHVLRAKGTNWEDINMYACDTVALGEFFRFASDHFMTVLAIKAKDLLNLILNPTTYKFFGEYLGVIQRIPWDYTTVRDSEGFVGVLRRTAEVGPAYVVTIGFGGLAWFAIVLGAAVGAVRLARDETGSAVLKWILISTLAYGLLVPLLATTRSTHRSTVEFIVVLLLCYLLQHLLSSNRVPWTALRRPRRY